MSLIQGENDDKAILQAEDEAIAAAAQRAKQPDPVDGGTVTAPPGTPLADLIEWMRDERQANPTSEGG